MQAWGSDDLAYASPPVHDPHRHQSPGVAARIFEPEQFVPLASREVEIARLTGYTLQHTGHFSPCALPLDSKSSCWNSRPRPKERSSTSPPPRSGIRRPLGLQCSFVSHGPVHSGTKISRFGVSAARALKCLVPAPPSTRACSSPGHRRRHPDHDVDGRLRCLQRPGSPRHTGAKVQGLHERIQLRRPSQL
jgi:hypothetical protein